jgi:anti-sigma regulatory factor (Ser/Thr protein kinase)
VEVSGERDIPNGVSAAAQARELVADALSSQVPESVLNDVRIVVSELVTNSFEHAGNPPGHPIKVTLDLSQDRVRIAVIDRSIFDPTPETPEELSDARWGLVIVDRIADGWGRLSEGGIWAEIQIP